MMSTSRVSSCVLAGLLGLGCASGGNQGEPLPRCEPVTTTESLDAELARGLAGDYRVVFAASSGARSGTETEARMSLQNATGRLRRMASSSGVGNADVLLPYYGTVGLKAEELGGMMAGSPTSEDPRTPGALVVQQNAAATSAPQSITIRLGSDANDRDVSRFDGAYFALRVHRLTPGTMAGTWASGIRGESASGHFCAFRAGS